MSRMRSWKNWTVLACSACVLGAIGCSSDDDTPDGTMAVGTLQGQGGAAGAGGSGGTPGGTAGRGGSASGSGGSAGAGGSSSPAAAGSGGSAGSAGSGLTPDAGSEGDAGPSSAEPDSGAVQPEDPDPGPGEEDAVGFSDVFQFVVTQCGNCHGANAPGARPKFAQTGNQAASFTATQGMSNGALVSARMVFRAVQDLSMPPACNGALGSNGCLTVAQGDQLQTWLDQGALP